MFQFSFTISILLDNTSPVYLDICSRFLHSTDGWLFTVLVAINNSLVDYPTVQVGWLMMNQLVTSTCCRKSSAPQYFFLIHIPCTSWPCPHDWQVQETELEECTSSIANNICPHKPANQATNKTNQTNPTSQPNKQPTIQQQTNSARSNFQHQVAVAQGCSDLSPVLRLLEVVQLLQWDSSATGPFWRMVIPPAVFTRTSMLAAYWHSFGSNRVRMDDD